MTIWDRLYAEEAQAILAERETYAISGPGHIIKFFDYLSMIFLWLGLACLVAVYFSPITLLNATCFFIISFVIAPSDGDRYERMIKGMAEDLANVRAVTSLESKRTRKG